jgi:predicted dehydrogenase
MASEANPVRIGLVGCGAHGNSLAQAIVRSDLVRLVGCADPDRGAAERAAALSSDISVYPSIDPLLASCPVDAVVIATPHDQLATASLTAIRARKHVLVEKPMAIGLKDATEVERAASQFGVNCMVGYSFRFSMGRCVQDLIVAGAVGEIQAVSGSIGLGPMNSGWTARPESGGGPLLYVGCHLIDLLYWLTQGEPARVFAEVNRRADTGADETSVIQITMTNGVAAQFAVTQAVPAFFYDLQIYGRSGSIALRGRNFLQFEIEVFSRTLPAYFEPTIVRPLVRRDNVSMMFVPELEEFARSIAERRPPAITAADGRRVCAVLDAIFDSGRTGQPKYLHTVGPCSGTA